MSGTAADDLNSLVTRGFDNIRELLGQRDERFNKLSENVARMEENLKMVNQTLSHLDGRMAQAEHDAIRQRVKVLEEGQESVRKTQESNGNWIRGLLVSVIFLLIGVVVNFLLSRVR